MTGLGSRLTWPAPEKLMPGAAVVVVGRGFVVVVFGLVVGVEPLEPNGFWSVN